MRTEPRISVGVSTLDRPDALARCLDALLSGELRPAEIVVVDQGDGESVAAIVKQRESFGVPLRHVRQGRLGLSASRNEMIRQAREPVLAITDDDCVPEVGWLAAVARAFAVPPVPAGVTGSVLALGPDRPGSYAVSLRTSTVRTDFTAPAIPWLVGTGANFAATREWLLRLGGYDERLGAGSAGHAAEDLELCHRFLRAGARIRYEPDAVVRHERQSEKRRMATRWSYGHGIGAACGILCRKGDWYGLTILARWLRSVTMRMLRAASAVDANGLRQARLSLTGTLRGLAYGWGVGPEASGERVKDERETAR